MIQLSNVSDIHKVLASNVPDDVWLISGDEAVTVALTVPSALASVITIVNLVWVASLFHALTELDARGV